MAVNMFGLKKGSKSAKLILFCITIILLVQMVNAYTISDFIKPDLYEGSLHKACRGDAPPKEVNVTQWSVKEGKFVNYYSRGGWKVGDENVKLDGQYVYCLNKINLCNPTNINFSTDSLQALSYGYIYDTHTPKGMNLYEVDKDGYLINYTNTGGYIDKQSCKTTYLAATKNNPEDTIEWWTNLSGYFLDPLWLPADSGLNLSVYYSMATATSPVPDDSGNGRTGNILGVTHVTNSLWVNGTTGAYAYPKQANKSIKTEQDSTLNNIGGNVSWTFGVVFNASEASGNGLLFTKGRCTPSYLGMEMHVSAAGTIACQQLGGTNPTVTSTSNFGTDNKMHLAVCEHDFNGDRFLLFIDGILEKNQTYGTTGTVSTGISWGQNDTELCADAGSYKLNGSMTEMRVYMSSLSPANVLAWWQGMGQAPNLSQQNGVIGFNQTNYTTTQNIGFNFTYTSPDANLIGSNAEYGNITINWSRNGITFNITKISLVINGSVINVSQNISGFSANDNITINITAIDQRNKNASPTINNVTSIVFLTPTFNQTLPSPIGIRIGNPYLMLVNCTSQNNEVINYTNNHTNLFTINRTTGLINVSAGFTLGQVGNYSIQINCVDSTGTTSQTYSLNINSAWQFMFEKNITNTTVYETSNQTFYVNFTYNASAFNITAFFNYNSTRYDLFFVSSKNNSNSEFSQYNTSVYRANVRPPIVFTNNSNTLFSFNITLRNSSVNLSYYLNDSQNRLFAHTILAINREQNYTEGSNNILINFTVGKEIDIATITGIIEFNRTNQTGTQTTETTLNTYASTFSIGYADTINQVLPVYVYANISYNGIDRIATLSGSNITISQIQITNCTNNLNSFTPTINVTIRDETSGTPILTSASWTSTILGYKTAQYNRTFAVSSSQNGSFTICYRPQFDNITANIDATYSNTSFGTRFYFETSRFINNLSKSLTLFLLQNATTGLNTVTITVNDATDDPLEGRTVEVYQYSFATGNLTFLSSQDTNFNGQTQFNLVTDNTYYKFFVKNRQTIEFQNTNPFIIFSPYSLIFRVSVGVDKTQSNILSIQQIPTTFVFNNVTKNVTFNYTDANNLIGQVCLYVRNGSLSNLTLYGACTTSDTGRLSYNVNLNKSVFYAYTTAVFNNDGKLYFWKTLSFDTRGERRMLFEGLILTFFFVGIVGLGLVFNPALAILGTAVAFGLMGLLQFHAFNIIGGGVAMIIIVGGIILAYILKT